MAAHAQARLAFALAAALVWLCGCATPGLPPVADRSPEFGATPVSYRVRPGDTLYSIAWRFRLDVDALARWNALRAPFLLHVDQALTLRPPRAAAPAPVIKPPKPGTQSTPRPKPATPAVPTRWQWPVRAAAPLRLARRSFDAEHPGITFAVPAGLGASAAAAGQVVYAGAGLGGFEHLIIVRHANALLSAYSFDGRIAVAEGAVVKVGAPLADISTAGRRASLLYFELRRRGSPIDPRRIVRQQ